MCWVVTILYMVAYCKIFLFSLLTFYIHFYRYFGTLGPGTLVPPVPPLVGPAHCTMLAIYCVVTYTITLEYYTFMHNLAYTFYFFRRFGAPLDPAPGAAAHPAHPSLRH